MSINLNNVRIAGHGQLLNNATLNHTDAIDINGLSIEDDAIVLQNLNIRNIMDSAALQFSSMSQAEQSSFQELQQKHNTNSISFLDQFKKHLSNFGTGILANIVSTMLLNQFC